MHIYKNNFHRGSFNIWDLCIIVIVSGIIFAIGKGLHEMDSSIVAIAKNEIYLDPVHLLEYTLQTT